MAKKTPQRRNQTQTRETNWAVVGGLIAIGVLVFGALLYLALRPTQAKTVQTLAEFCAENSDNCIAMGEETAPVTLVEVSDFGCVHCQAFHKDTATPLKEKHLDNGDIRWIVMPYALSPSTVPAAASGLCANEQGRYFDYANTLYTIEPPTTRLSADGFRQAAETVGLDMDKFISCMDDGRFLDIVGENRERATSVGVTGTPTFFLNDQKMSGAQPLSAFTQAIDALIAAQ